MIVVQLCKQANCNDLAVKCLLCLLGEEGTGSIVDHVSQGRLAEALGDVCDDTGHCDIHESNLL